jgi:GNAT superfamily N-acetyltransferase
MSNTHDKNPSIQIRHSVRFSDSRAIREIVTSSRFFNEEEIDVAVELVDERLEKGETSGYYFLFAEMDEKTIGYSCYGPIAGTLSSFDLYWIAVHNDVRARGIGKILLQASEQAIQEMSGHRIYVETSSREQYAPTRAFYKSCHYEMEAILQDFYALGDSKCIFVKVV